MTIDEQREKALEKGNRVRTRRSEIKRALKRAEIKFVDALDDPDVQTMKVFDLLCALPFNGPSQAANPTTRGESSARKLLRVAQCTEATTVKELNCRRRPLLLAAVQQKFPTGLV